MLAEPILGPQDDLAIEAAKLLIRLLGPIAIGTGMRKTADDKLRREVVASLIPRAERVGCGPTAWVRRLPP